MEELTLGHIPDPAAHQCPVRSLDIEYPLLEQCPQVGQRRCGQADQHRENESFEHGFLLFIIQ
ncbi:hypothetical protein D3C80_1988030 [compost metagenome]